MSPATSAAPRGQPDQPSHSGSHAITRTHGDSQPQVRATMGPTPRVWAVTAGPATVKAHTIHLDNRTTASPPRRTRARRTPHRPPALSAGRPRPHPATALNRHHRGPASHHHGLTAHRTTTGSPHHHWLTAPRTHRTTHSPHQHRPLTPQPTDQPAVAGPSTGSARVPVRRRNPSRPGPHTCWASRADLAHRHAWERRYEQSW